MKTYGLIGIPLTHSFSQKYFTEKFAREKNSDCIYKLFPFPNLKELPEFIRTNPGICGLNVTIPYKIKIVQYLDEIDDTAFQIGAINTIKIYRATDGSKFLKGYNTDAHGFELSLKSFLGRKKPQALVLGSGGSSKAVQFVLKKLKINFKIVSRNLQYHSSSVNNLSYDELNKEQLKKHLLIINTTPLGMAPAVEACPPIPYEHLSSDHMLFDLIYNPEETLFLQFGKVAGAKTKNGMEMLQLQAEKSWEIWQE